MFPGLGLSTGGMMTKFPTQPGVLLDFYGNPTSAVVAPVAPGQTVDVVLNAILNQGQSGVGITLPLQGTYFVNSPLIFANQQAFAGARGNTQMGPLGTTFGGSRILRSNTFSTAIPAWAQALGVPANVDSPIIVCGPGCYFDSLVFDAGGVSGSPPVPLGQFAFYYTNAPDLKLFNCMARMASIACYVDAQQGGASPRAVFISCSSQQPSAGGYGSPLVPALGLDIESNDCDIIGGRFVYGQHVIAGLGKYLSAHFTGGSPLGTGGGATITVPNGNVYPTGYNLYNAAPAFYDHCEFDSIPATGVALIGEFNTSSQSAAYDNCYFWQNNTSVIGLSMFNRSSAAGRRPIRVANPSIWLNTGSVWTNFCPNTLAADKFIGGMCSAPGFATFTIPGLFPSGVTPTDIRIYGSGAGAAALSSSVAFDLPLQINVPGTLTSVQVPGAYIPKIAGMTVTLDSVHASLQSGTSASIVVQVNGTGVTGLNPISVTTTATDFAASSPPSLNTQDFLNIVIGALVGAPVGLSLTARLSYTATE